MSMICRPTKRLITSLGFQRRWTAPAMIEAQSGLVIRYAYLWARVHQRGEESGRKSRPVCVQILFTGAPGAEKSLLFPITSQSPRPHVRALELPETEARRVGLRTPAWIISRGMERGRSGGIRQYR